jgi:hypothetical protein
MGLYGYAAKMMEGESEGILNMFDLVPYAEMQTELLAVFIMLGVVTGVAASVISLQKNLNN